MHLTTHMLYVPVLPACRFDGLTVMHKFDIKAGHVTYRNRHLVKEMESYIREYNRPPSLVAYDDPCGSFLGRAFSTFIQAGAPQTMYRPHPLFLQYHVIEERTCIADGRGSVSSGSHEAKPVTALYQSLYCSSHALHALPCVCLSAAAKVE